MPVTIAAHVGAMALRFPGARTRLTCVLLFDPDLQVHEEEQPCHPEHQHREEDPPGTHGPQMAALLLLAAPRMVLALSRPSSSPARVPEVTWNVEASTFHSGGDTSCQICYYRAGVHAEDLGDVYALEMGGAGRWLQQALLHCLPLPYPGLACPQVMRNSPALSGAAWPGVELLYCERNTGFGPPDIYIDYE